MRRIGPPAQRRVHPGVALVVALIHVALVIALARAFAPEMTARMADQVFGSVTVVTVTTTPPKPPPPPPVPQTAQPAGAAAPAGKRATPAPVAAPSPRIVIATQPAAPIAGQGSDRSAGARDAGSGTGAGGQGSGTGAAAGGRGTGGGGAKVAKIAGDINATRDYPEATRELRLGDYVIVALTVGTDGRVKACRVHRASRDPQADQITCRLATERFRFRPATDWQGNPIESVYGWQQRWFAPSDKPSEKR